MTSFEKALSSYLTSTRHSASIGGSNLSVHMRRKALLRYGNVAQAESLKRAQSKDQKTQEKKTQPS